MKVIDPGHVYALNHLPGAPNELALEQLNQLVFVKREGIGYPGNVGHHEGTNLQEVLRAMIHRVEYLDQQIPDLSNGYVLHGLRKALWHLEERAARRHGRVLQASSYNIEQLPTCRRCGHVECEAHR